jgi:hypothetical protein
VFDFIAVVIKNTVAKIESLARRFFCEQKLITANAEMAICNEANLRRRECAGVRLRDGVEHDEIIALAVHFGEAELQNLCVQRGEERKAGIDQCRIGLNFVGFLNGKLRGLVCGILHRSAKIRIRRDTRDGNGGGLVGVTRIDVNVLEKPHPRLLAIAFDEEIFALHKDMKESHELILN